MRFGVIEDITSPDALCDGISTLDSTVDENRQRVSALEANLPLETALERRTNLTICTGVVVGRIGFSQVRTGYRAERVTFQKANTPSELRSKLSSVQALSARPKFIC